DSWESTHLAYTHGYGVVLAPSNASQGTDPEFIVRDVPPVVDEELEASGFALDQPRIYFGEDLDGYIVVGTNRDEIDFQDEDTTRRNRYEGADGVPVNSIVRRAAFALRFGDLNPLISDCMIDEPRAIYHLHVDDLGQTLAPFLLADTAACPIVIDARLLWVVHPYTTTSRNPYAQQADTDQPPADSGLR